MPPPLQAILLPLPQKPRHWALRPPEFTPIPSLSSPQEIFDHETYSMEHKAQKKYETYSPKLVDFHERLKKLMDQYAFEIYEITKKFPKDEIYSLTSQLRRAGLSVILNYIEGYARRKKLV